MSVLKAIEALAVVLNKEADQAEQSGDPVSLEHMRLKRGLARRMVDVAQAAAQQPEGTPHPLVTVASWLEADAAQTQAEQGEDWAAATTRERQAEGALNLVLDLKAGELLDVAADHQRLQRMERDLLGLEAGLMQALLLERHPAWRHQNEWYGRHVARILRPAAWAARQTPAVPVVSVEGEETAAQRVLFFPESQEELGRAVHAAWRDGMLAQGRNVPPHRLTWRALGDADRLLDRHIGLEVAKTTFVLLAKEDAQPTPGAGEQA
ncbi:hypothetical protein GO986_08905 [Deinococcus sp. HMF7620]|uniref:Uncharacterized protein n=1 Tax=Deinococcus arboris TaxID=2682977 RepID=A0A7C9M1Q5_9DEIO|nr:hypothetical protein [Deinococcus arboris]MVN86882.1 hypothetical protein [Deinococcus arboris]